MAPQTRTHARTHKQEHDDVFSSATDRSRGRTRHVVQQPIGSHDDDVAGRDIEGGQVSVLHLVRVLVVPDLRTGLGFFVPGARSADRKERYDVARRTRIMDGGRACVCAPDSSMGMHECGAHDTEHGM